MAIDEAVADLKANSTSLTRLECFLKDRAVKPADIDSLINTLALVDCLKDDDIEVLQTILAPIPKRRKSSRRARKQTSPDSRPRKPTKTARQPTRPNSRLKPTDNVQQKKEQIPKYQQEESNHVY
jgi:hypothetical protein